MAVGDGVSIRDFAKVIGDRLRYVAPTFVGKKHLSREYTPPRYVWTVDGENGDNPPTYQREDDHALHDLDTTVVIHCWAKASRDDLPPEEDDAFDNVEALRDALVTVFRTELEANYRLGRSVWSEPGDGQLGVVISQSISFTRALLERLIPDAPTENGGGVDGNLGKPDPDIRPGATPETFTLEPGLIEKPDGWLETREPE